MKKTLTFLALACAVSAVAQNHPGKKYEDKEIHFIGNTAVEDSLRVYEAFIENAPKVFNIAGAPRFALVGKNEKFYFGIGGSAKVTAGFDFPNPIVNGPYFTTSSIPMGTGPNDSKATGNGGRFMINGQQTYLFFNFVAFPNNPNKLGFYFNFDLCGTNYTPNIQYAYLTYRDFTVGYTNSLFFDGAACPPTIDKEGPNSLTWEMSEVIDYAHTFNNGITLAAGAELGPRSFTYSKETSKIYQRCPDFPVYFQYNFKNSQSYIRFSAMFRDLQYRNELLAKNKNVFGWGVKASGVVTCTPKLTLYYQAAYGKGITSYFQDVEDMGLDLAPVGEGNDLKPVEAWGGYIGLQYNWTPRCYSAVMYSHLRNYAKKYIGGTTGGDANPWDDQYRYAQYVAANVFYNITSQFTWGLEWDWGRRVNMDGVSKHNNRIQTMLQFTF